MPDGPPTPQTLNENGGPPRGLPAWAWIVLAAAIVGPRAARMAAPRMWLEDTPYPYAAFLITRGQRPHGDFVCPHFPVLEFALAAAYRIFGASPRTAETLTQIATALSACLVFALTRRAWVRLLPPGPRRPIHGFGPGVLAALLFGACSLTFRFHLFEREVFLCVLLLASTWVLLESRALTTGRAVGLGAVLALGFTLKLTFALPAAVLVAFVALDLKRPKAAAVIAGVWFAACAAATALFASAYGRDFLFQVFGFHLFKGRNFPDVVDKVLAARLWCSLPLIAAMVSLVYASQLRDRTVRLMAAVVIAYVVFFVALSPTLWAHNMLMLLPGLSILGGLGVAKWATTIPLSLHRRGPALRALTAGAVTVVGLLWIAPPRNKNWRPEAPWGFAGMSRHAIATAGRFLRDRTDPEDLICAPPIVALAGQRLDPFHYRELAGVCQWARAKLSVVGQRKLRLICRYAPFYVLEEQSRSEWMPRLLASVETRSFAAVVPETHDSHYAILLPRILEPSLRRYGYQRALHVGLLDVWLRPDRAFTPSGPAR